MPERARKWRRSDTARQQYCPGIVSSDRRNDTPGVPALDIDLDDRLVFLDRRTRRPGGRRNRPCRKRRLRMSVGRRKQAATPVSCKLGNKLTYLSAVENARTQLKACRDLVTACHPFLVSFRLGGHENPAGREPGGVLAETFGLLDPEPVCLGGKRNLGRVTALLAHEAPRTTRLFGCDRAALEHRHLEPALGEQPSGTASHDAAADDRDIDRLKGRCADRVHPHTSSNTRRKLPPRIFVTSASPKPRALSACGSAAKSPTMPNPCA